MKKLFNFRLLVLIGVLIASINQVWADDHMSTGQVFYFKPSDLWKTGTVRFASCFQYIEGQDGANESWYSLQYAGETDVYYAVAPNNYYDMYFCRMNGSNNTNSWDNRYNQSGKLQWQAASDKRFNYFQEVTTDNSGWKESTTWTRYAPKMYSASLSDNGTVVVGGSGTEGDPYLILVGTTIKVSASATSCVPADADQTKRYNFKTAQGAGAFSSGQDGTDTEYEFTASSSINVVHKVKVSAYNRYSLYTTSNIDGTPAESSEIHYKTVQYYVVGNGNSSNWLHNQSWQISANDNVMTYDDEEGDWYITFINVSAANDLEFIISDGTSGGWGSDHTWRHGEYYSSCTTNLSVTGKTDQSSNTNTVLTITNPSNITIRFNPTASTGEKICASAVPLYNNLAVTVSPSGAAADPTISTTYVPTATNSVTITAANANGGYTWLGWTANGGTITTSSSQSTTWSPGASGKTATANYTENNYVVTVTAGDGGTVDAGSVTGHVSTSADLPDATPYVGYRFVNWTVSGATITNATSATEATINGMTSDVTVTANFERVYAYVEGRFQVNNAARNSITYTSTENTYWSTTSRNIQFGYEETNHRFKLHTYMKPSELAAQLSSNTQYFSIKTTSTLSSTFENEVLYTPASTSPTTDQELSTAGGKKAATSSDHRDDSFYFTSSDNNGYAILYFDQSDVWYELEHTLTYDGNKNTSGSVSEAYYDHNATATVVAAGTFLRTGYTLTGWSGSDGNTYASGASITMTQNLTLTAQWSEDTHTVTVAKDPSAGGTISTTSVSGVGIDTPSGDITATANTGYYFSGWTIPSGVTQNSLSTTNTQANSTSTITIKATEDSKTLTANFGVRYAMYGSLKDSETGPGMPGWTTPVSFDAYDAEKSKYTLNLTELKPNTVYKLKIKDQRNGNSYGPTGEGHIPDGTQWTMNGTVNTGAALHFKTKGVGTYVLTTTETGTAPSQEPTAKIDMPTSYTVTYGEVTDNGQNGGSISSVVDNGDYALSSGDYVAAAGSATFTAGTPTSGYSFIGWYTSSTYGEGTELSTTTPWTLSTPNENKTVYAHYAENLCTVTINANNSSRGSITVDAAAFTWGNTVDVGVFSTKDLEATPATGYYFAGWTLSDGADCTVGENMGEDYASVTLTGLGTSLSSTATLTANFLPLEKVYFRNWNEEANGGAGGALWENVYVYFSIDYENGKEGTSCAKTNGSEGYKAQMTLESDNVYWAYVPRATTRSGNDDIAFSNTSYGTGIKFYTGEGVMRSDYRTSQSMFVPRHASNYTRNDTKYYNGYWKHHNVAPGQLSGYSIERYKGSDPIYEPAADNGADNVHFIVENENTIRYSLRVDNPSAAFNNYMIYSDGAISYITYDGVNNPAETGNTITTTNYSRVPMSEYDTGNPRFCITPTTQNLYTLTIDMSGDEMKLTVDYPVALNDYRIVLTYNSTKKAYSDIIKSSEAGSGVTASMYIYKTSTPELKLEKCTDINPVTWTPQGSDVWGSHYSKFTEGNGVYMFDVTISGDAITNIENVGIYDGEFYIKTDIASGGWTAWKANIMEKNTITFNPADSKTFDRSFCHWIGNTTTNVKCVIANDYNIAVSDTLESDAILGGSSQYLPSPAHVRFSYNSTTNELKRTYLAVSGDDHLILEGNTLSTGAVYLVHNPSTHSNYRDNKATLNNVSNFTFGLDIEACEKARVRLSAKYNSVVQYLIGEAGSVDGATNANTVEIMGGITDLEKYNTLRISYDFKTNQLLSAWLPPTSGNSPDKAINADVMIIREGQDDARQITFANSSDKLSAVDTIYGVMKFEKSTLNNSSLSPYERDLYWISFPFDVKLSDAFGMGTYGIHWIIERYDGKTRAQKGFWADSESNWKFVTPYQRDSGFIMKANEGYILALDLDELGEGSLVWDNDMTEAYLYFPSKDKVGNIKTKDVSVTIDTAGYTCTIGPRFENGDDRRIKDSHWHCIGAPSFANINHDATTSWVDENSDGINDYPNAGTIESWKSSSVLYVYDWNSTYNTLTPVSAASHNFKAMHSYMVQYSKPSISWSSVTTPSASIAARMTETPDREYQLALLREDDEQDHTFVRLTDDVNVSTGFEFNFDLSKEMNRNRGNIWTVTSDGTPVAGNSQPHPLTTTIVPVGVKIAANGEYTFSMPEGTNGGDVWLIDNANSSRTNLGLMDYTVNLTTGTYEGRFSLEFPVQNVVTDIENAANANANANADIRKVFIGGRLYILRDGKAYDATGAQVR